MSKKISRRKFVKITGGAAAAAGLTTGFLFPQRAQAQQKTLKIIQWGHFVPGYDKWFDGVYTKEWGAKNNVNVVVDHIAIGEINARAAAEVSAKKGHDLFMFLAPPAAYEKQVIDHREIYEAVQKKHGKSIELGYRSTYNPKTKKFFAFSDSFVPDPGNYRQDLWSDVGFPNGPDSWHDLLVGGKRIKDKHGNPVGIGLSQELDTNMAMRAILWSHGGSEQDANGNVVLNSKHTLDAVKYVRELYKQTMTAEVFSWDPSSNNRGILAGKLSYVANAISVTRSAEKDNPDMSKKIQLRPALKGPVRRIACEHVMDCYVIWDFAENKADASKFLIDYVDNFETAFKASEFYNFPCFPSTVPNIKQLIANDPKGVPPNKYAVLGDVLNWATNVGYPGYANAAIAEIYSTWVLNTMFGQASTGAMSPEDAVKEADAKCRKIWQKWKERKLL